MLTLSDFDWKSAHFWAMSCQVMAYNYSQWHLTAILISGKTYQTTGLTREASQQRTGKHGKLLFNACLLQMVVLFNTPLANGDQMCVQFDAILIPAHACSGRTQNEWHFLLHNNGCSWPELTSNQSQLGINPLTLPTEVLVPFSMAPLGLPAGLGLVPNCPLHVIWSHPLIKLSLSCLRIYSRQ